jgi:WD40 repeat protein
MNVPPQQPRRVSRRIALLGGIGGLAVVGGGAFWFWQMHASVNIPGIGDVSLPGVPVLSYKEHEKPVLKVGWSPDGKYIASGSQDNTLKIWTSDKAETKLSVRTTKVPPDADDYPWSLSWSAKHNWLAVAFIDGNVQVLDPASGKRVSQLEKPLGNTPLIAWSPDEKYLAITAFNNAINICAYPSWEVVQTYNEHTDWVETIAWSPDGKYIVSGANDNQVRVWDPLSAQTKIVYPGHTGGIVSVGWSPDSKYVISTAQDYKAVAWAIESGSVRFTYKGRGGAPMGMATWSHNGKHIALYDGYAEVVLLDATTGKVERTISSGVVYDISWSPDDTKLVTGSYENVAEVWSVGL